MRQSQQRAMKRGLSERMQLTAELRRCPKCGRGYAISSEHEDWGDVIWIAKWCRWCDYREFGEHPKTPPTPSTEDGQAAEVGS